MRQQRLTKLELQILEALWWQRKASVREILETFPEPRPAYTTVQTTIYRMEGKNAVRRVRKIGNADIFEPVVPRDIGFGGNRHELRAICCRSFCSDYGSAVSEPWLSFACVTGVTYATW